ncbi:MAG TPA: deaminase, partial [Aestuariivirgaceae bacterium]|nr:deaminase [Aestuariivirgaceae bacterium]
RYLRLLFGHKFTTPGRDEYGMYLAKAASLRSADLSRQVGAAIFTPMGEVISIGSNEVPKGGGGTYFEGDIPDYRDYTVGGDYNEREKHRILKELLNRMAGKGLLSEIPGCESIDDIASFLLSDPGGPLLKDSRVMDLLEFGRQIHAEMSALVDAARLGRSVVGAVMFSTAFPCHMCAKLIIGAGITRLVYLEPYPKSYAEDMYPNVIDIEARKTSDGTHVLFEPFTGVSPFRYRDLFEKGRRKEFGGDIREWKDGVPKVNIPLIYETYLYLERLVAAALVERIAKLPPLEKTSGSM